MFRRLLMVLIVAALAVGMAACHNKKVQNPIANVDSKQPDKVLFDRAMDAMKHNKFDVARMSLQTLINTYPDSEYVARAKLSIGDAWYAEGGTAALTQAEAEYQDFQTFFPNMPEAAEAQMKVANIEFMQMEKPDRDFTHTKRAEEAYRQMLLQYPDSKLAPQAKERLREVQEVLAEREFRIGRFYYLRESWPAAIARLKSLTDAYPLYSNADEALFLLGDSYQEQLNLFRLGKFDETIKGRLTKENNARAAEAYSELITRYPLSDHANEAKKRLEAMHAPVPTPTQEAIARNKAEIESRGREGMWGRTMGNFHRHPDMSMAARTGEPTLVDPKPTSAPEILRHSNDVLAGRADAGSHAVTVEPGATGGAAPPPNQPTPRSDTSKDNNSASELPVKSDAPANDAPAPAPRQVNQVKGDQQQNAASSDSSSSTTTDQSTDSSSKKKKKKGLKKLIPF